MTADAPAVAVGAAAVLGTLVGQALGAGNGFASVAIAVVAACGAWLLLRSGRGVAAIVLVIAASGALGAATMQRALDGMARGEARVLVDAREAVTVSGTLADDPKPSRFDTEALVRVATVDEGPRRGVRAFGRVVLVHATASDGIRLAQLEAGDRVELAGDLAPLSRHEAWLRWRHAVGALRRTELRGWSQPRGPLVILADALRDRVLDGLRVLAPRDRALLAGFLLGDTRQIDDATRADFDASGLSHLLAVSGANVAFALAVVAPLRRRLRTSARIALGLAVVVVFATMTRFEPSVLRASAMAAIVMAGSAFGRPVRVLRALAYAVLLLVLVDPFLVHSFGFWLSVGATAGIAVLARPVAARLPGPRAITDVAGVSIAAQVGVLPVLLLGGASVPWVAPAANVLAVPVAEPISVLALPAAFAVGVTRGPWAIALSCSAVLLAWVRGVAHTAHTAPVVVLLAAVALGAGAYAARRAVASH